MSANLIDVVIGKVIGWIDQLFSFANRLFFNGQEKSMNLLIVLILAFFATKVFKFKFNLGGGK
jgi:hypothetical protein